MTRKSDAMTIVIVDDEPSVRRTIGDHLSARGHDVREAEDGETAIRLAGEMAIDAIITDLRMPGLDGVEVLNQVRAVSPSTDLPCHLCVTDGKMWCPWQGTS